MTANLHDLAGGVFVDSKRGPTEQLHACTWKADKYGARQSACKKVGRFLPPFGADGFAPFPTLDQVTGQTPPRCDKCLMAKPGDIAKCG